MISSRSGEWNSCYWRCACHLLKHTLKQLFQSIQLKMNEHSTEIMKSEFNAREFCIRLLGIWPTFHWFIPFFPECGVENTRTNSSLSIISWNWTGFDEHLKYAQKKSKQYQRNQIRMKRSRKKQLCCTQAWARVRALKFFKAIQIHFNFAHNFLCFAWFRSIFEFSTDRFPTTWALSENDFVSLCLNRGNNSNLKKERRSWWFAFWPSNTIKFMLSMFIFYWKRFDWWEEGWVWATKQVSGKANKQFE